MVLDWYTVTMEALQNLWQGFITFIPTLLGAIIVFVVGWFISVGVGKLVTEILKRIGFNKIFAKGTWKEALEKAEFKVDASGFIGGIFKWVLVVVFLLAAVEILGMSEFAGFLTSILAYLPNVLVAAFILVVAAIVAEMLEKIVRAAIESTHMGYGNLVGAVIKWSIWIFAVLAILIQLNVAPSLIQALFTGLIAAVAISVGLSFGLGCKDIAGEMARNLYRKLKD